MMMMMMTVTAIHTGPRACSVGREGLYELCTGPWKVDEGLAGIG